MNKKVANKSKHVYGFLCVIAIKSTKQEDDLKVWQTVIASFGND